MAEEKANTSKVGSSAFFTKDQITQARKAGYTDQQIALHISEGSDEIKKAMEEGYSLDEIADSFAIQSIAKEEKKETEEEKRITGGDIAKMVIGTALDIGISEGGKIASTFLGTTLGGAAGLITGPGAVATAGAGGAWGYGIGAPFFGALGSTVNQLINTGEVNPAVTAADALTNAIPLGKVTKAGDVITQVSKFLGKAPIKSAVATGTFSGLANVGARDISTDEDITLEDYATQGALGGATTLGFIGVASAIGKLYNKFKNKTPTQLIELAESGDADAIELVDMLTAGVTPEESEETVYKSISFVQEYIKDATRNVASRLKPSEILGANAVRAAKLSASGIEASVAQSSALGKRIDKYLIKNPDEFSKQEVSDLLLGREPATNLLPENIKNDIFEVRSLIDEQQGRLLDLHNSGQLRMPEAVAAKIEKSKNIGDYITQPYRFFTDPSYKPSKDAIVKLKERLQLGLTKQQKEARLNQYIKDYRPPSTEVEALRRKHGIVPGGEGKSNEAYQRDLKSISTPSADKISKKRKQLDKEKYTEAQANEYIAKLNTAIASRDPDFVASFTNGKGTPDFLKEKKVLSLELEDYLGRIKSPGERAAKTISYLSRVNEITEADANITQALLDSGALVTSKDPRFASLKTPVEIQLRRGIAQLGEETLYGDPALQVAINKIYGAKLDEISRYTFGRIAQDVYESSLSLYKAVKVLGNVPAYLIQVPGNISLTLGAGMNTILGIGKASKMAVGTLRGTPLGNLPLIRKWADQADIPSLREFRKLQSKGLIASAVPFGDIKAGLNRPIGRIVSKILDVPGKIYSFGDNIFRIVNYNNNKLELRRLFPTASDEIIENGAATLTQRTYPNYDSLSAEVKNLSRTGLLIGPYSSYGLELTRTQWQQGRFIVELADGSFVNKLGKEFEGLPVNQGAAKMLAAKRAAAMATVYAGATYGFNQINRNDLSEEQEKAFRETIAPEYAERKSLAIKRNKDGSFSYVNTSYYVPQTMLLAPFQAGMRGETFEQVAVNFIKTLNEDYGGATGSFAFEAAGRLSSGRETESGDEISSSATLLGQVKERLAYEGKKLTPSTIVALEKQQPKKEKIARLLGLRVERTDIEKGFGFRARDIVKSVDGLKKKLGGELYNVQKGKISPQEYEEALKQKNNDYKIYMERMQQHVANLKTLDQDDSTIISMLKDAGFANAQVLDIIEGKFTPLNPVIKETALERYAKIRKSTDAETMKAISEVAKDDSNEANTFAEIFKQEKQAERYPITPKEKLIASLPTDEKVKRLLPEIMASNNPDAYIFKLAQKKIISKQDAEAIRISRNLK